MLRVFTSFFNELGIENKNYAQRVVSWFIELETKESMLKMASIDG